LTGSIVSVAVVDLEDVCKTQHARLAAAPMPGESKAQYDLYSIKEIYTQ